MMNIFKRNVKIKFISIVLAFLMWIYVMAEVDPILIRDFNEIPVKITNEVIIKEKDMVISPNEKLNANVIVRGRRSLIKDIYSSNIHVYAKIKSPKLGENEVRLYIDGYSNVDYTIIPNKLNLSLEKNIEKKKYIEIDKSGKLGKSLELSNVSINPQYTMIKGPKSVVEKVDKLICKLNLENKSDNFTTRSKIVAVDKDGKKVDGIQIKDEYSYVNVGIFKSKQVPIKINIKGSLDKNYKFLGYNADEQKITIIGKSEDIDKIQEIDTEYFDISGLNQDKDINLKINIPKNIKTNLNNINVNFDIVKIISKDFVISKNRIVYNNNIQNLDISKNDLPENIKIKVDFSEDIEKKVKEEDIQLFVEMKDSEQEPAKYEIRYSLPYPVEKVEIEPKYVTITN